MSDLDPKYEPWAFKSDQRLDWVRAIAARRKVIRQEMATINTDHQQRIVVLEQEWNDLAIAERIMMGLANEPA